VGIEGLAVDYVFASEQSFGENSPTALFIALTEIPKRNSPPRLYRVLKFPEVFDMPILRSKGIIRVGYPTNGLSILL
jgi:hypothetical protein